MSLPWVNASASIDRAASSALESVCTLTSLKSRPNRGSKNDWTAGGSGFSPDVTDSICRATASLVNARLPLALSRIRSKERGCPSSGSGIRIIASATRSASPSYLSPGSFTVSFG
jgi:hypothetical protein